MGNDISFDLALIRNKGVTIHAFDATPSSVKWYYQRLAAGKFPRVLISHHKHHRFMLSSADGNVTLKRPRGNAISLAMASVTSPRGGWWSDAAVELPGKSIWSMMSMLGHTKIDVLKIDVEGSEFSIFTDLASSKEQNSRPQKRQFLDDEHLPISPVLSFPVCQILVEFHPHFVESPIAAVEATWHLQSLGFDLIHFIHQRDGAQNALFVNARFCLLNQKAT